MNSNHLHVVIVDSNEDYALKLERKFLYSLRHNMDLDVITDLDYFKKFFSEPVHIDVALIAEEYANTVIANHDIGSIFILCEDVPIKSGNNDNLTRVYKYTSMSHVFNQTMGSYSHLIKQHSHHDPRLVVFYSPIGGSGKTTLSVAVASCLQKSGSRVLFMDAEYQQEMGSLFSNVKSMRNNSAMAYNLDAQNPYATVKSEIIHDIVDVIPPISQNIMMYGITFDLLINTLEGAKRSGDYDYVIADTDSCFSPEKLRLIQKADVLIIPTTQELMAIKKTCAFLNGLDTNGRSKTLLVCNYVDKNMYSKNEEQFERQGYRVEARIYFDAGIKEKTAEEYASIPDFIALSYLVK